MIDPYLIQLQEAKKRWDTSSILLTNQVSELQNIERSVTGKWKEIIGDHIQFIVNFNNEAFEFIDASMRYHTLQRFENSVLRETVMAYASKDPEQFISMIKLFRNAKNDSGQRTQEQD